VAGSEGTGDVQGNTGTMSSGTMTGENSVDAEGGKITNNFQPEFSDEHTSHQRTSNVDNLLKEQTMVKSMKTNESLKTYQAIDSERANVMPPSSGNVSTVVAAVDVATVTGLVPETRIKVVPSSSEGLSQSNKGLSVDSLVELVTSVSNEMTFKRQQLVTAFIINLFDRHYIFYESIIV